jgi:hypothetical protein
MSNQDNPKTCGIRLIPIENGRRSFAIVGKQAVKLRRKTRKRIEKRLNCPGIRSEAASCTCPCWEPKEDKL